MVFYDGGFVNDKENDFSLDEYADNIGIGARLLMMGSPLKLDYGIPLNVPDHLESSSIRLNFIFHLAHAIKSITLLTLFYY